jgi:aspartate racemase
MVEISRGLKNWKYRIGIVGGVGPYAHIELELCLAEAAQQKLRCRIRDQDFPSWYVASVPQIPDRVQAILLGNDAPVEPLLQSLSTLREADFAVIACNTAHAFFPLLQQRSRIPLMNMPAETISFLAAHYGEDSIVGLLASDGALMADVYTLAARHRTPNMRLLSLPDLGTEGIRLQESLMACIFGANGVPDPFAGGIKGGGHRHRAVRGKMLSVLNHAVTVLHGHGAKAVILGCTELPVVLESSNSTGIPLINPMSIVAREAIEIAAGDRPLPFFQGAVA